MFLPGCDAILDSSIWGHARSARAMYTSAIYVSYIYGSNEMGKFGYFWYN